MNQEAENDEKLEEFYSIVWGQSTGAMKIKLKVCEKYKDIRDAKIYHQVIKINQIHLLQLSGCEICTVRNIFIQGQIQ